MKNSALKYLLFLFGIIYIFALFGFLYGIGIIIVIYIFFHIKRKQKLKKQVEQYGKEVLNKKTPLDVRYHNLIKTYLETIDPLQDRQDDIQEKIENCVYDIAEEEGVSIPSSQNTSFDSWYKNLNNKYKKLADNLLSSFSARYKNNVVLASELLKHRWTFSNQEIHSINEKINSQVIPYIEKVFEDLDKIELGKLGLYSFNNKHYISINEIFQKILHPEKEIKTINTNHIIQKDIGESIRNTPLDINFNINKAIDFFNLNEFLQLEKEQILDIKFSEEGLLENEKEALMLLEDRVMKIVDVKIKDFHKLMKKIQNTQKEYNKQIEGISRNNGDQKSIEFYSSVVLYFVKNDYFRENFNIQHKDKILVIEYNFPSINIFPKTKEVKQLKNGKEKVILWSEKERNDIYDNYVLSVAFRTMYTIFSYNINDSIEAISFNAWVNVINKATGQNEDRCIVSILAKKEDIMKINLTKIDPKAALKSLRGISAPTLSSLTPIQPTLNIDREDSRFVEGYGVIHNVDEGTNLASMDWQDFENLIREILEKEFSEDGFEVNITQASRDGGIDAVMFDPNPLKGGRIVVQAKRYTNTVGISAVRDLHSAVVTEGANKGILVTTATFGPDSYKYVAEKNLPITLVDGSRLLGLLQNHGYNARINIEEAKIELKK